MTSFALSGGDVALRFFIVSAESADEKGGFYGRRNDHERGYLLVKEQSDECGGHC